MHCAIKPSHVILFSGVSLTSSPLLVHARGGVARFGSFAAYKMQTNSDWQYTASYYNYFSSSNSGLFSSTTIFIVMSCLLIFLVSVLVFCKCYARRHSIQQQHALLLQHQEHSGITEQQQPVQADPVPMSTSPEPPNYYSAVSGGQ
ncbi:hypothetical protein BOX15_Mlig005759g1 [Macrostomum lignano]|uniref:Uncharacterized protein n=1 Tax=Macrostomum lignano TaxID=282301 RepID=A0A267E7L2_9PLAT|nr:hypothetical protein BOX15_Mlig005759g1 [Macrostomum lignano]